MFCFTAFWELNDVPHIAVLMLDSALRHLYGKIGGPYGVHGIKS